MDRPPVLPHRVDLQRDERAIDLTRLRIFRNEMMIITGFLILIAFLVLVPVVGAVLGVFERLTATLL